MITLIEIKQRFRNVRLYNDRVTVKETARVTGLSEKTIRRHSDINDSTVPGILTVAQMCEHYGISLDLLVFGPSKKSDWEIDARWRYVTMKLGGLLSDQEKVVLMDMVLKVAGYGADTAVDPIGPKPPFNT